MTRARSPETLAAQMMGWTDSGTGALIPPIQPATTFLRDPDNGYRRGFVYARNENPTAVPAEALLAALEGGREALLFGSGTAAAVALFLSLDPGDHVVAPRAMYYGLRAWLESSGARWGLQTSFVDMTDLAAVRDAVRPGRTRLLWAETPANPSWEVCDIAALAEIALRADAPLAVDNTVPTPVLTRPLGLGADVVLHSATKYLNGHSDVLAGALVTKRDDALWGRVREQRRAGGAVLGPFESWLLGRGMRTLHLRVRAACAAAMHLAAALERHPQVERVLYPGLPTHPGHLLAARQMEGGYGGMLSILVRGGAEAAVAAAGRVQVWKRATSLGGVESLVEHRHSIEGPRTTTPPNLLRLSVGIEAVGDLMEDLHDALQPT